MSRHSDLRYSDDWSGAVCAQIGGAAVEDMFCPEGPGPGEQAKALCRTCPMARQCLDLAMKEERGQSRNYRYGIRGALTAEERHRLDWYGQVDAA